MDFNKALFGFIRVAFSIMIALLVLFAGIKICSICYDFGYRVFTEPAMTNGDGQDVLVQVEKGISAEELGQLLEDKGLVRDHNLFYLQLKLGSPAWKASAKAAGEGQEDEEADFSAAIAESSAGTDRASSSTNVSPPT